MRAGSASPKRMMAISPGHGDADGTCADWWDRKDEVECPVCGERPVGDVDMGNVACSIARRDVKTMQMHLERVDHCLSHALVTLVQRMRHDLCGGFSLLVDDRLQQLWRVCQACSFQLHPGLSSGRRSTVESTLSGCPIRSNTARLFVLHSDPAHLSLKPMNYHGTNRRRRTVGAKETTGVTGKGLSPN